jgi:hypothetical protein
MAGALHVAGPTAQNQGGQINGEADTSLRFDTTAAIQQFNLNFGDGNWTIDSISLSLREVAAPGQPLFSHGQSLLGAGDRAQGAFQNAGLNERQDFLSPSTRISSRMC